MFVAVTPNNNEAYGHVHITTVHTGLQPKRLSVIEAELHECSDVSGYVLPLSAARCYASAALAVMRSVYPSVRPSVTFVHSVETNEHIYIFFTDG